MKRLLLLSLMIGLVFTSVKCKKDKSTSAEALLTAGTWNGVNMKRYDGNGNLIETVSLNGLTLDFYDDGTVKFKDHGVTMHSGEWELLDNDSKIHFDWGAAGDETSEIRKLTDDQFIYGDDYHETTYER